ncbi:MAG: hypothetical protein ABIO70_07210 [Pseudomonadota bacterium]
MSSIPAPSAGLRAIIARFAAPGLAALVFLTWAGLLLWPALAGGAYVLPGPGGQDSDVIRGAWSLSQAAWGLPDPIWTHRVYFPLGVKVVPLPFASGLLLAPVQFLLGPLGAYDVSLLLLLATTGWCTAWLGRELTGSWGLGAVAGGALVAQPMLLHAMADGTPEHVALWSLPAALAAAWRAHRTGQLRWAPVFGLLLLALLLDSPYMAVFGLVVVPSFLAAALLERPAERAGWRRWRPLTLTASAALPALALVAWLYHGFTLAPQDYTQASASVELAGNSTSLRTWWGLEAGHGMDVLGNLVPALIPTVLLVPMLLLAMAGLRRGLPWLLAGLLMLVLAFGSDPDNPRMLAWWLGSVAGQGGATFGHALGQGVLSLDTWLLGQPPFSGVRFPRRWLVPAAMFLSLAGVFGLRGLLSLGLRRPALKALLQRRRLTIELAGVVAGLAVAGTLLQQEPYLEPWDTTTYPNLAFADWLRAQPGSGAVMAFPTVRPGKPNTHRWELPVYANISDALRSGDQLYFQLAHRRPIYEYPALFTVVATPGLSPEAEQLVRDTNDMGRMGITGEFPPSSSFDPRGAHGRAEGRAWLQARGLRFVVLDLSVYQGEWLDRAVDFFEPLASQERFDDGDGVLVLELAR